MIPFNSVQAIREPEFINVVQNDLNPLMSSCQIKVFYLGQNRNHSSIDKSTAIKMAKTLRGSPIVGQYIKEKGDFNDHASTVNVDENGITFGSDTFPYGFVSPDSKIWFQDYVELDSTGQEVVRTYMMCTGYLWTGQYPECQKIISEGQPHSMELDSNTLDGHWTKTNNEEYKFFIIEDATFFNLCILGDDVEPCFEGSSIEGAPAQRQAYSVQENNNDIATSFAIDDNFKAALCQMMQQLNFALKGGNKMEDEKVMNNVQSEEQPAPATDYSVENDPTPSDSQDSVAQETPAATEFEKKEDEEEKKEESSDNSDSDDKEDDDKKDEDNDESAKKYAQLEASYNELSDKYALICEEVESLRAFKNQADEKEKDALIANFYMLSDEDKADVIANKSQYSLDEIEQKLSVICFRKKVNFNLIDDEKNEDNTDEENIHTYSISGETSSLPAWLKAVKEQRDIAK